MPLYTYACKCGHEVEEYRAVSKMEIDVPVHCCEQMQIRIFAPMAHVRAEAHYICPVTGEKVTTRRQRKYLFDKHRLADYDDYGDVVGREKKRVEKVKELANTHYTKLPNGTKVEDFLPVIPA